MFSEIWENATACYTNVNFIDTSTQPYTAISKEIEFIIWEIVKQINSKVVRLKVFNSTLQKT